MRNIEIQGQIYPYKTLKDVLESEAISEEERVYNSLVKIAELISKELHIPCPDIGFSGIMLNVVTKDNYLGICFSPNNIPKLTNYLVILDVQNYTGLKLIGNLAHECRHIYQEIHNPDIYIKHANDFIKSCLHPAEIDADGYAIHHLMSIKEMTYDEAAELIYPEGKVFLNEAYKKRIRRAKEIDEEIKNKCTL